MDKDLQSVLPKSIEVPAFQVIIGGVDTPREKSDPSDNFPSHTVMEEPLAPPDVDEVVEINQHVKTLDEVLPFYQDPNERYYTIGFSENAKIEPLEKCSINHIPKKKKKSSSKKSPSNQYLFEIWDDDSRNKEDDGCALRQMIMPTVSTIQLPKKGMFTEDDLHRTLTEKYLFGVYGSSLYVRDYSGAYSEVTVRAVRRLLLETLTNDERKRLKISLAKNVYDRLLDSPEVRGNSLVFPQDRLLFSNGVYNIRTKLPVDIQASDFFTTCIHANYLPNSKLYCPFFDAYLESVSGGDKTIKRRICAMLAYLMLPGYPGKKIIVLGMAKDSGKSAIIRFFQRLIGPELVCAQTPFDMCESHALSEFSGKMVNTIMDMPATAIKPAGVGFMKTLSGGDMISINPKGRDRRSIICYTKQVLGTNSPLRLQQFDAAFWERIVIIPYLYSINHEDQIPDLEERLWEERDAIVTKCMKQAKKLLESGYDFPPCPEADAMKDSWIGWQAHAKNYILSNCIAEVGTFTPSTPFYDAYLQYCNENSLPYGTSTAFIRLLKNLFDIPLDEEMREMVDGKQRRGIRDVSFIGALK